MNANVEAIMAKYENIEGTIDLKMVFTLIEMSKKGIVPYSDFSDIEINLWCYIDNPDIMS